MVLGSGVRVRFQFLRHTTFSEGLRITGRFCAAGLGFRVGFWGLLEARVLRNREVVV